MLYSASVALTLTAGVIVAMQTAAPASPVVATETLQPPAASSGMRPTRADSLPGSGGPVWHHVEGKGTTVTDVNGAPVAAPNASALPYTFTFDVSWGIDGRHWVTSTGKACLWLAARVTSGTPLVDVLTVYMRKAVTGPDPIVGQTVYWPMDDVVYYYCWEGLQNAQEYYFWQGLGSAANGAWVHGHGDVSDHI